VYLGELLRRHRARQGLSQEELAARASLSVRAIRDLERGRVSAPHARSVHRLASALNLAPAEVDDLLASARPDAAPDSGGSEPPRSKKTAPSCPHRWPARTGSSSGSSDR
jgi:transcriptional regulator with XRE-family HTH domain